MGFSRFSKLVAACTAAASIRRVSGSRWDRSGDDVVLSDRSGRVDAGFSKDHCRSCVDTATLAMAAVVCEGVSRLL